MGCVLWVWPRKELKLGLVEVVSARSWSILFLSVVDSTGMNFPFTMQYSRWLYNWFNWTGLWEFLAVLFVFLAVILALYFYEGMWIFIFPFTTDYSLLLFLKVLRENVSNIVSLLFVVAAVDRKCEDNLKPLEEELLYFDFFLAKFFCFYLLSLYFILSSSFILDLPSLSLFLFEPSLLCFLPLDTLLGEGYV